MRRLIVSSITIEDAVALLINLDYIPTGFTLLDMTAAFLEEAEVNHHNAKVNHLPAAEIAALQIRMDVCAARHSLAQSLTSALRNEINNPDSLIVVLDDNSSIEPQLTMESLINWASDLGIGWTYSYSDTDNTAVPAKNICWEDVTIKIYKDYRIAYSINKDPFKKSSFQNIGLMGIRKNEPNLLGGILIGFSQERKYPTEKTLQNKHAAAISKLRLALKNLTGISSDPFHFNEADGYKPCFKIIDDRKNADERAKDRAVHVPYDETRDFEDEGAEAPDYGNESDPAQKWLDENG